MNIEIINKKNYPIVEVTMNQGEKFKLESGAMLYKSPEIVLSAKTNGGIFRAAKKSLIGGENFFATTAESTGNNAVIGIAPKGLGDLFHIKLEGTNWYLEDGVFLASSDTVEYNVVRNKNLGSALFGGSGGFFLLKTSGTGDILVEAFGSIIEKELVNEEFYIDNYHVIGWEETLTHSISVSSGVFGYKTGEGLVTKLSGTGKVLLQTRQPEAFVDRILSFIPHQK